MKNNSINNIVDQAIVTFSYYHDMSEFRLTPSSSIGEYEDDDNSDINSIHMEYKNEVDEYIDISDIKTKEELEDVLDGEATKLKVKVAFNKLQKTRF